MTERPEYNEDFMDMLAALREAQVEFLVVGAHALAVHGVIRASGDLDVLVRPGEANARRVILALQAFGAPLRAHGISEADFCREGTVYQLGLPPRRVDLLTAVSGLSFDEAWDRSIPVRIGELEFRVPDAKDLLANKRASGRPKDVEDARQLEAILAGSGSPDGSGG